jgi:hypothetical protein
MTSLIKSLEKFNFYIEEVIKNIEESEKYGGISKYEISKICTTNIMLVKCIDIFNDYKNEEDNNE